MGHTPNELAEEFPQDAQRIRDLKLTNPHFSRLVEAYHEINRNVHRAETKVEPTDELHEGEMRKKRLHLKDEIWRMLSRQS